MTTYNISADVQSRIETVKGIIDTAIAVTNTFLGTMSWIINPAYVTAGQSDVATIDSVPGIDIERPVKPDTSGLAEPSLSADFNTAFQMPEAGSIADNSNASASLNFIEPNYTEWMLTDLKTKIGTGFDDLAVAVHVEAGIFARQDQRFMTARNEAITRRRTRWSSRGFDVGNETLNAREAEVSANFNNAYSDMGRDKRIKRAELKDDNRKAMILSALKGEAVYIQMNEDIATRALDAAEAVVNLAIEAFKSNIGKYKDVTVEQYRNELLYFTEDLKIKLGKSKVDIAKYVTNTKILSEKNRMRALNFEVDAAAFEADAYFNESKAGINTGYNTLALEELEANMDLKLAEIKSNLAGFVKKATIQTNYAKIMGIVYSQYLSSAMQSINVLLDASKSYVEKIKKQEKEQAV